MKEVIDILESIKDGAEPLNESQAFSWVETARHLANTALIIHNDKLKEDKKTTEKENYIFTLLVDFKCDRIGINKTVYLIDELYKAEYETTLPNKNRTRTT